MWRLTNASKLPDVQRLLQKWTPISSAVASHCTVQQYGCPGSGGSALTTMHYHALEAGFRAFPSEAVPSLIGFQHMVSRTFGQRVRDSRPFATTVRPRRDLASQPKSAPTSAAVADDGPIADSEDAVADAELSAAQLGEWAEAMQNPDHRSFEIPTPFADCMGCGVHLQTEVRTVLFLAFVIANSDGCSSQCSSKHLL